VALAGKPLPACGNGVIDPGEQCDQANLNGQTCVSQGFAGGILKCGAGCVFDTSGCSAARFVDNGDGTVTDHQTGLQWEKKDNLDGMVNDADPHDADNVYTWCIGTFPGCTNLVAADPPDGTAYWDFLGKLNNGASTDGTAITGCFAGHCDWRLPTPAEMQTILLAPYFCGTHPCIDPVFGPTQSNFYWSATADYPGPFAWTMNFDDGFLNGGLKFEGFFTRAVRGGS
jgi:hypothetical protein